MKEKMRSLIKNLISGSIGAAVGYGAAKIGERIAEANVKVRPELTKVDWLDAFLSGHLNDWLFYHHSSVMEILLTIIGAIAGFLIYQYLKNTL